MKEEREGGQKNPQRGAKVWGTSRKDLQAEDASRASLQICREEKTLISTISYSPPFPPLGMEVVHLPHIHTHVLPHLDLPISTLVQLFSLATRIKVDLPTISQTEPVLSLFLPHTPSPQPLGASTRWG